MKQPYLEITITESDNFTNYTRFIFFS